ncbi:MAG: hypothetical protein VW862_05085 [Euryarchaeota archaeon]
MTEVLQDLRSKEGKFHGIDKQFLTEGLRLVLFLPAFALLFIFGSWAFSSQSPTWWLENIEPTLGFTLSTAFILIALTILVGYTTGLAIHRYRMQLTRLVFRAEVNAAAEDHRPINSMHGYSSVDGLISKTMASHNTALFMSMFSITVLALSVYFGSDSELGQRSLLACASMLAMSLGQHLSTRNYKFNMVTNDGLLSAYEPPIHPSTLCLPFSEILSNHMDPLLRSKFDDFLRDFESNIKRGVPADFGAEKFLMLMHRRFKGRVDRVTTNTEIKEILTDKGIHEIMEHKVFSEDLWDSIFLRSEKQLPAFYRLIDRIEQDMAIGKQPDMPELLFDVDLENVVTENANLFCYMHNLSDKDRQIVLRVNSPDFRPQELLLRYNLKAGQKSYWPKEAIPDFDKGDEDRLGRMSTLLQEGTLSWQTLLPEGSGDASVAIRLENIEGDLLVGRQINVNVRPEFVKWFRNTSSITSYVSGAIGLTVAVIFQLLSIINV